MQNILSIDLTLSPPVVAIFSVDGTKVSLLEAFDPDVEGIQLPPISALFPKPFLEHESADSESASTEEEPPEEEEAAVPTVDEYALALLEVVDTFAEEWVSCVLVLPTGSYSSLNIELPFIDPKALAQVIDIQVADQIPFDLDDFAVSHHAVYQESENRHDIHVSFYIKEQLQGILKSFHLAQCEPYIAATPSSSIAGLLEVPSVVDEGTTAVFCLRETEISIALLMNGMLRCDRTFELLWQRDSEKPVDVQTLLKIEQTLLSFERHIGAPITKIILCGDRDVAEVLGYQLDRSNRYLQTSDVIEIPKRPKPEAPVAYDDRFLVAGMATLFARDDSPPTCVGNMRTGDFAYRPQLSKLFTGLKPLYPWATLTSVLALVFVVSWTGVNSTRREKLRTAMIEEVRERVPDDSTLSGASSVSGWVQSRAATLESSIARLGSPLANTPLDVLKSLSADIASAKKRAPDLNVSRADIRASRATLEINVPDFKQLAELEEILEKRTDVYCSIKKGNANSSGNSMRSFSLTIELCQV